MIRANGSQSFAELPLARFHHAIAGAVVGGQGVDGVDSRREARREGVERARTEYAVVPEELKNVRSAGHRAQRETTRQSLAECGQIGCHSQCCLGAPQRHAKARDDLVEAQQDAVLAAQFPDAFEIAWPGRAATVIAEDGFHQDQRDAVAVRCEGRFEGGQVVPRDHQRVADRARGESFRQVGVGVARNRHGQFGRLGPASVADDATAVFAVSGAKVATAAAAGRIAAGSGNVSGHPAKHAIEPAMIVAKESQHVGAPGIRAGQADSQLHGLGTGDSEPHPLRAGDVLDDPLGKFHLQRALRRA